jgi:hypothetical protein
VKRGERRRTAVFLNVTEKRCFWCGVVKTLDEFARDRSKPSGFGTYCLACDRERSRAYYQANREMIWAKAAAKRGPQPKRFCSECGVELEGRSRVCCGKAKCRDRRFKRLQPEAYARREVAKVERRREKRRQLASASGSSAT